MKPMNTIYEHITKAAMAILGGLWAWVQPTLPFAGLCILAAFADMVSVWRLSARIKKQGRTSEYTASAGSMIGKLIGVYTAMLLAAAMEATVLEGMSVRLPNIVAGAFCGAIFLEILKRESSENDNAWARIVQLIVKSKIDRHIDLIDAPKEQDNEAND